MDNLLNTLVRITAYRGEPRNRVARVVDVRDIKLCPITPDYAERHPLQRSRYLITIHDLAKNEFRSYYHNYVTMQPMKFSARVWFRIRQWWENN